MLNTPFRVTQADRVVPGAVVEHDGQAFVVDEVRRNLEGIDLLGWPRRYEKRGRRVRVFVKPTDDVKLLANDDELAAITTALFVAVAQAAAHWWDGGESPIDVEGSGALAVLTVWADDTRWLVRTTDDVVMAASQDE